MYNNTKNNSIEVESHKRDFDALSDIEYYKRLSLDNLKAIELSQTLSDKYSVIYSCGSFVSFSEGHLVGANFCRERFCTLCQKRKSLKVYSDMHKVFQLLGDEYTFVHLVLTVRNVSSFNLSGTIDKLFSASRKLFNNSRVKQGFKGVMRCLEVSYNSAADNYHPHLHCLCVVKPSYFHSRYYLKQADLSLMWADALGVDYSPQIYITKADTSAALEIAKYSCKPLELDLPLRKRAEVFDVLNRALKGRRLIQFFGVLREVTKELKINFDTDNESLPAETVESYHFDFATQKYLKFDII